MIEEIELLMDRYVAWIRNKTTLKQVDGWIEISTPYLDRHNDYLQMYAKKVGDEFLLTDGGYIIDDLSSSGCELNTPKRQELLKTTLRGFGVELSQGELRVRITATNFASRQHDLVQAMLAVNDLFYLAVPVVSSLFLETVVDWLDSCDIRYSPRIKLTGKSGYDHLFDFIVPKSKRYPERILQMINRPSRDAAQNLAFSWLDTRDTRPSEGRLYALLNDTSHPVSGSVIEALRNYDIVPVVWSERESVREELAA